MTSSIENINHIIGTALSFGVVLFLMYRRFRRTFGRQKLKRGLLRWRIGILSAAGLWLMTITLHSALGTLTAFAGLAIGAGLAFWAAWHTRFEKHDGALYFIPHTYTGIAVSALFLGRIAYRLSLGIAVSPAGAAAAAQTAQGKLQAIYGNPATLSIFFILAAYYICYYAYVLRESSHPKPDDWEPPAGGA